MLTPTTAIAALTDLPPYAAFVGGAAALLLAVWLTRGAIRALAHVLTRAASWVRARRPAELLTYLSASIATGVAAQGMWRFFGDVLAFPPLLRALMFAFLELAVITSAVRARENLREHRPAGADGAAVWVLTGLSAVLSAMDAHSAPERVFRLGAPLVAAWLWERGMAGERRRATTGATRTAAGTRPLQAIHWRISPARVLVHLGLAEATDRNVDDVDATRRLTRIAQAAKRARTLRAAGAGPARQARAVTRLEAAVEKAVTHAGLAHDTTRQDQLLAQLGALYSAATLMDLSPAAPWQRPGRPPIDPIPPTPTRSTGSATSIEATPKPIDPGTVATAGRTWTQTLTLLRGPATTTIPIAASPTPSTGPGDRRDVIGGLSGTPDVGPETAPSPAPAQPGWRRRPRPAPTLRPADLTAARAAIAAGDLPAQPSAEALRTHLRISPAHARTTRDHLAAQASPPADSNGPEPAPRRPSPAPAVHAAHSGPVGTPNTDPIIRQHDQTDAPEEADFQPPTHLPEESTPGMQSVTAR